MNDHRTAQDVEVHQGGDVGTSGVENGRDRDSMLATDDAEADKRRIRTTTYEKCERTEAKCELKYSTSKGASMAPAATRSFAMPQK
eukprot:scaffold27391_cov67-Attheya_sp.AAC.1